MIMDEKIDSINQQNQIDRWIDNVILPANKSNNIHRSGDCDEHLSNNATTAEKS